MGAAGYAAAAAAGVLFGLSDSLVRVASTGLGPAANLVMSLSLGLPVLVAAALAGHGGPPGPGALAVYALAGLLNFVAGRFLFYTAISALGASTATVLTSPTSAVAALLAWPLLGEALTPRQLAGIALLAIAAYAASSRPSGSPIRYSAAAGVVAALLATLSFASSTLLVRYASARLGGDPLWGAVVSYAAALPPATALAVARGELGELAGPWGSEHRAMAAASATVALAQALRYYSLGALPVAESIVLMGLFPLHTVAFSHLLAGGSGERPGPRHALAAVAASVAIVLVEG